MNKQEFLKYGHEFVEWAAEYLENAEKYPVTARISPGDIRKKLPSAPPETAESMETIFRDFREVVMPGITHWQHPGWFAYFPANNSPASVLAELLTASLGAQCMSWNTSPAAAELEEVVLGWLRGMLGLPESWAGVIQDTASTSTLAALLTARERATGYESNAKGLKKPLTVYSSTETHSSAEKGVKIAGYGRENLRVIPVDRHFGMDPAALERAVAADEKSGLVPACVVATVGTTSSGGIDPLASIGRVARAHGMWFHVDAAYAGTAALLPEKRHVLDGVELADSFVFNPHKWMLTNFDCSVYFVRDAGALVRTFEIHPEYLKTGVDAQVNNYRDWGIQLGRRFRALKLWFVLRSYGVEGIRAMVREHLRLAGLFKGWVESDPCFELLAPVHFGLVCFRFNDGRPEAECDALNRRLLERINASGRVFLTHTTLRGKFTIRLVVGQRTTAERHVREAWDIIRSSAESLAGR
jgi:aromatic-L-amino-acid/L-tryptophan decarboxylase